MVTDAHTPSTSVLFVCLGNICRSPMAESVFRQLVVDAALTESIQIDSAGTGDWHIGSDPHPQTQAELERNGITVPTSTARQVTAVDLRAFDHVIAMDSENLANLQALAQAQRDGDQMGEISLLLDETGGGDVPDPYLVGGYDAVYALVAPACEALLARVRAVHGL